MKTQATYNAADAISRFIESSGVVVFLILVGILIMAGAFYGAKLWYDIKEIRKRLDEQEQGPEPDTPE